MRPIWVMISTTVALIASPTWAAAQVASLTGTSYFTDFNNIGTTVPDGITGRANATVTALGTNSNISQSAVTFGNVGGQFANYASANNATLTSTSSSAQQSASTDRAFGVRQRTGTGAFGDPGAAFTFQGQSAIGALNFTTLEFDSQVLAASDTRDTTFTIRYGLGSSPTSFTTIGNISSAGSFGSTPRSYDLTGFSALQNTTNVVTFQLAALDLTSGSGSYDTFAIDNLRIGYAPTPVPEPIAILLLAAGLMIGSGARQRWHNLILMKL